MTFSYFRKSAKSLKEILANLDAVLNGEEMEIVGNKEILNGQGRIIYFLPRKWVESVVSFNHNLLPFLPLVVVILEKENNVIVGSGRGSLLGNFAYNEEIFNLAQEIENKMKRLVNAIAQVNELRPSKVKLYTTTTCPYCKMEKAWLDANKISYEEVLVDLNQKAGEEMVRKTGQVGVPVTEIIYDDADPDYIIGFDKPQLEYIFGIK